MLSYRTKSLFTLANFLFMVANLIPAVVMEEEALVQIIQGWIDTARRCRTWRLLDTEGNTIAEITTLRGAKRLLRLTYSRIGGKAPRNAN
jgi:hypothetical protein